MTTPIRGRWSLLCLLLLISCQEVTSGSTPRTQPGITQAACEAQAGFAFVDGGEFIAGSDRTERDYAYRISAEGFADDPANVAAAEASYRRRNWFEREPGRRTETLPSFCMGENLITNADYQAFVQATGHRSPGISAAEYQEQGFLVHGYDEVAPYVWQGDQYPTGQGQHPVVLVSYGDALAYAEWRSGRDGASYRLPTALEWEKAARGTDGQYFPWGSEWRNDGTNWAKNGPYGTSEVGAYPLSQSLYGVEDMAGNVFEYTSTLTRGGAKVLLKGCSWDDFPGFCRAAYQHDRPVDSRHILFGFRLLMEND
ncbi:formylglycine-generating enzyme family protein [Leptothoe sp. PORK10 BA2]|uniref:formylglycine-generating enzyme family protein n=1 Tax=Leptothoe sp. PORK10 BA2 TaxID=3110254 RepID=UPI002B1FF9EB|nr:SUMF1/EgtB/PvdO family nonheme iron enzyme [Leptothoe sp. PORK10 BA2]MEA5463440.1 SUMF1/EgtB/PvdO family nonheme iron enzyme [Leptothoe sp. PORK10 BA2]